MIDFLASIDMLLKDNLTQAAYKLWVDIKTKTPMVMHRPSSASGRYHLDERGNVRTIGEHTYQILFTTLKILRIFNINAPSRSADVLLLAGACHDLLKYGADDPLYRKSTDSKHDKLIADVLLFNKKRCLESLQENDFVKLEQICRFHSGRWSTDATENFNMNNFPAEVMFIHMLDMLSANNLLNVPGGEYVVTKHNSGS